MQSGNKLFLDILPSVRARLSLDKARTPLNAWKYATNAEIVCPMFIARERVAKVTQGEYLYLSSEFLTGFGNNWSKFVICCLCFVTTLTFTSLLLMVSIWTKRREGSLNIFYTRYDGGHQSFYTCDICRETKVTRKNLQFFKWNAVQFFWSHMNTCVEQNSSTCYTMTSKIRQGQK